MAYGGNLYQLRSKYQGSVGEYVRVNGPYDTFGVIQKSEKTPEGDFLNLIRGVKPRPGETYTKEF